MPDPARTETPARSDTRCAIELTDSQLSALECSGVTESPEGDEAILVSALDGNHLRLHDRPMADSVLSVLIDLANREDDMVNDPRRDAAQRAGDRGARKAFENLADRIIECRRGFVIDAEDIGKGSR